ncbi:MAG: flavin reductase family protein [Chloroflexota bacterium]
MPVDPMVFRRTLGCFATGVTVVTAVDAGGVPRGLTANAFSSLSLDPTLILVCVDHQADTFPVLSATDAFAVNILTEDQRELSRAFAGKGDDKFRQVPHRPGLAGVPLIEGALAILECLTMERHVAGDHTIFIGDVRRAEYRSRGNPLLFFRGNYARLPEATVA